MLSYFVCGPKNCTKGKGASGHPSRFPPGERKRSPACLDTVFASVFVLFQFVLSFSLTAIEKCKKKTKFDKKAIFFLRNFQPLVILCSITSFCLKVSTGTPPANEPSGKPSVFLWTRQHFPYQQVPRKRRQTKRGQAERNVFQLRRTGGRRIVTYYGQIISFMLNFFQFFPVSCAALPEN